MELPQRWRGAQLTRQLFANDFPALLPGDLPLVSGSMPELPASGSVPEGVDGLFASEPVRGRCSVLCFHPRHDVTLARMNHKDILAVVQKWRKVYLQESDFLRTTARPGAKDEGYVQIFEVSRAAAWRVSSRRAYIALGGRQTRPDLGGSVGSALTGLYPAFSGLAKKRSTLYLCIACAQCRTEHCRPEESRTGILRLLWLGPGNRTEQWLRSESGIGDRHSCLACPFQGPWPSIPP